MAKVLVIGEKCIDIFVYGTSSRKSPEGAGPVFIPVQQVTGAGMAGNTARNLQSMGLDVDIVSNTSDIIKTRYVNQKTNELYLRVDENDAVDKINLNILSNISQYDAVVISDYCKGFLSENDILQISLMHPLTIVDTKKHLGEWCRNIRFIKINRFEFEHNKDIIEENEWLLDKLIITLDGAGALYKGELVKTEKVENADVSGAGDTFVAGFITKYLSTQDVMQSISWANYCAGVVVREKGVSVFKAR